MDIPIIALDAPTAEVTAALRAAWLAHGFCYVVNHGVPAALVADQFDWAARFFALPRAEKAAISLFHSPARRGWEDLGAQTLDAESQPDRKESFYSGVDYPPEHPNVRAGLNGYGANQWPAALPGFAAQMERYTTACTTLAERLMRCMALSLDLDAQFFDASLREPMITLRLLRYPPQPAGAGDDVFGAGAHTDWGAVTILAQDAIGGLEVQTAAGAWVAAPPVPASFVVNLGDMIPRWTNGRYRSTPHRVINANASGRDRYSVPFFFSPNYHARIEAVPGSVPAGEAPRFAPCTAGEHLEDMYRRTYGIAA